MNNLAEEVLLIAENLRVHFYTVISVMQESNWKKAQVSECRE